jgi:hypothetical protein
MGLENIDPADFPECLNALLASPDEPIRRIAESIAAQYGRRLGYLIASIMLSPRGLTSPIVRWEKAYLQHWKQKVEDIVLGGGLSNGRFGELIRPVAEGVLVQCGIRGLRIHVSRYPSYLPLIGMARSAPKGIQGSVVVTDFGGTKGKRGLTFFKDHVLYRLQVLPSHDVAAFTHPGKTTELAHKMVASIAETIGEADPSTPLAPNVLCSVAAYVQGGQPIRVDRGGYYALHRISPDLCAWFSQQIGQATGKTVQIEFYHDCDVAARALAGRSNTAVLMLGSALGVGFVPPGEGYRPVSDRFTLVVSE